MRALGYFLIDPSAPGMTHLSRQDQERAYAGFCRQGGHTPVATFVETSRLDRPEYRRMLEYIRSAKSSFLVIVNSPTHLGNDLESTVASILELHALGCRTVSTQPNNPDPLKGALEAWITSSPHAARRQKIVNAMRAKAMRGRGLGKTPYGYTIGATGKLQEAPQEAALVRLVFQLYLEQDLGIRRIAQHLNEKGFKTRKGTHWSMVTIRDMLRNRTYLGTYSRFGVRIPGNHPGLVSHQDFRVVQERMKARGAAGQKPRREPFLLSGLLYCGHCGNRMIGVTRHQTWSRKDGRQISGTYRYYQCQSRTNRGVCQYHTKRASIFEKHVLERVVAEVSHAPDSLFAHDHSLTSSSGAEQERKRQRRFVQYVQRAANGVITLDQLVAHLKRLAKDKGQMPKEIAPAESSQHSTEATSSSVSPPLRQWDSMGVADRRELLKRLVHRVIVKGDSLEIELAPGLVDGPRTTDI